MWYKILTDPNIQLVEKSILLYLLHHAKDSYKISVGIDDLTKDLNISRQAYFNNIKLLQEKNYIKYTSSTGRPLKGSTRKSTFRLLFVEKSQDSSDIKLRIQGELKRIAINSNLPIKDIIDLLSFIYPDSHYTYPYFLAKINYIIEQEDTYQIVCKEKLSGKSNFLVKRLPYKDRKINIIP